MLEGNSGEIPLVPWGYNQGAMKDSNLQTPEEEISRMAS